MLLILDLLQRTYFSFRRFKIEKKFKARELLYSVDDYVDIISQCHS